MALTDDPYNPFAATAVDGVDSWGWLTPDIAQYLSGSEDVQAPGIGGEDVQAPGIAPLAIGPGAPGAPPPETEVARPPSAPPPADPDDLAGAMFGDEDARGLAKGLAPLSPFVSSFVPDVDSKLAELAGPDVATTDPFPTEEEPDDPEAARRKIDDEAFKLSQDPFALARASADRDVAMQRKQAAAELDAATRSHQEALDNHATMRAAQKHADEEQRRWDAEAAKIASEDPRSSVGIVTDALHAAIAGFLNPRGPNSALELIQRNIERKVSERRAALADKRRTTAGALENAAEDFKMAEAVRIGEYEKAKALIQSDMANYDPRGATVIQHGQLYAALATAQGDARERLRQQAHKEGLERARFDLELQKRQDDIDKFNIARQDKLRAAAASARGKELSPVMRQALLDEGYDPKLVASMTKSDLRDLVELKKTGLETGKKREDLVAAQRENAPVPGLTTTDGGEVTFRNAAGASKIAKQKTAVDRSAALIDQLVAARAKYGWTPDLFKSDAWRDMQADYGALLFEVKDDRELGAITGADMELAGKALGTDDPTELRDPIAGLKKARANIVNRFNTSVQNESVLPKGQKPARYEPPKLAAVEADERTPEENAAVFRSPLIRGAKTPDAREKAAAIAVGAVGPLARQSPDLKQLKALASEIRSRAAAGEFTPEQEEEAIDQLRAAFRSKHLESAVGIGGPVAGAVARSNQVIDRLLGIDKGKGKK